MFYELKITTCNSYRNTGKKMYRADAAENSRLFILAGKGIQEETFREKFEQYGKIQDLWIVKDKRTNEDKGQQKLFCVLRLKSTNSLINRLHFLAKMNSFRNNMAFYVLFCCLISLKDYIQMA